MPTQSRNVTSVGPASLYSGAIPQTGVAPFVEGWQTQTQQEWQPCARPVNRAGIFPKEDGVEQIQTGSWINYGFQTLQDPQPPKPGRQAKTALRQRTGFAVPPSVPLYGWLIQDPQPPFPKVRRFGALAQGDAGNEGKFTNWINLGSGENTQTDPRFVRHYSPSIAEDFANKFLSWVNASDQTQADLRYVRHYSPSVAEEFDHKPLPWLNLGSGENTQSDPRFMRHYPPMVGDVGSTGLFNYWINRGFEESQADLRFVKRYSPAAADDFAHDVQVVAAGIIANLSVTEANDTLAATGSSPFTPAGWEQVQAYLRYVRRYSPSIAEDFSHFLAAVTTIVGNLTVTEADDTLAATGTVGLTVITANLAVVENNDRLAAVVTTPPPPVNTGWVDRNNSAPLNTQATGGVPPSWQANSVLIGTVWVRRDDSPPLPLNNAIQPTQPIPTPPLPVRAFSSGFSSGFN